MTSHRAWTRMVQAALACGFALCIGLLLLGYSKDIRAGETTLQEHQEMVEAYSLFKEKCLGCHMDVTDPEKAGKTKDEWYVVVNIMKGHGVNISPEESAVLVSLMYTLRPGMEEEPG